MALGHGQHPLGRLWVRRGLLAEAEAADMPTWRGTGGFSLDGSVRITAHDRAGLERLLRYCARPPFALHRLRHATPELPLSSPDARVIYHLPRPARDGRSALRLAPLELLERLARLIPPPRVHRHRYHGVFAPNAAWRGDVVAGKRWEAAAVVGPGWRGGSRAVVSRLDSTAGGDAPSMRRG